MMKPTYSVASNPAQQGSGWLHVRFAGESQTRPEHALGPKIYDHYLLHIIESGYGIFRTETDMYQLGPGDCFLIHPGQIVSYVSDASCPWQYRWVAFDGEHAGEEVNRLGLTPDKPVLHLMEANNPIPGYVSLIQKHFQSREESSHIAAIGYLHLIWAEILNRSDRPSLLSLAEPQVQRTVKQMINYMASQYAHPVSIEQMCASLGYNRAYLSRIFKQETGMTPITYLLKLRIDQSKRLLRERPDLSIEQVSASVGLTDPLYFSRQFKRLVGRSPTRYRKDIMSAAAPTEP
ncbi:AraC family transcriptional regulator [Paenibacillus glucanolyticus]|jgi:AraC-like DNA-binding protein|uniref:AraC family transcriptional regulator n=1 Tax=Paenibacillus TaxID=44249 RepID=UPI0004BA63C0|nr:MULTISPECIES: AraC family transcriptional regulator [Paenibacillus]ANA81495.1 AraC family transcriptional regulator [Paenibacillus glucanolyticus]AVV59775.1 AraC family transcriptional regulator [Paenibacillus glucanolyticus]MPY19424.1 AraC family transcriptional regulator [Paenibacillus glucanolyticus]